MTRHEIITKKIINLSSSLRDKLSLTSSASGLLTSAPSPSRRGPCPPSSTFSQLPPLPCPTLQIPRRARARVSSCRNP